MTIEEHFTEEGYGVTFNYEPNTVDGALVTFSHGDKCVKFDLSKEELNQLLNFMNKINDYIIK